MSKRKCGSCDKIFSKNEANIECSACKRKYHFECTSLNDDEFTVLSASRKLKWFCILCDEDVDNLLTNFEKFRKVSIEIEKIKSENEARLAEIEKRLVLCENGKTDMNVQKKIEEQIKKSCEEDQEEANLIKSKEQNLVYFDLPESANESTADRMKDDFNLLAEAYSNKIEHKDISNLFRVGKKTENKNRPLVVKFSSLETRTKFLKSSGDLKIKRGNVIKPVYMSIDRTQKQREAHKILVEQLKSRRASGEQNLVIRGDKIVKVFQKEAAAQRTTWASLFQA